MLRACRRRALACVAVIALASLLCGCVQLQANRAKVFVNPGGQLTVKRRFLPPGSGLLVSDSNADYRIDTTLAPGETSILVDNESNQAVRIAMARLDAGTPAPALLAHCTPDVGPDGEPEYSGRGYQIVAKLDELPAYAARYPTRSQAQIYIHLSPGRYVVFSTAPGDWCSGRKAEITVPDA